MTQRVVEKLVNKKYNKFLDYAPYMSIYSVDRKLYLLTSFLRCFLKIWKRNLSYNALFQVRDRLQRKPSLIVTLKKKKLIEVTLFSKRKKTNTIFLKIRDSKKLRAIMNYFSTSNFIELTIFSCPTKIQLKRKIN